MSCAHNSVRAALGLKPLKDGPPQRGGRGAAPTGPEAAAAAAVAAQAASDDKAAALAARVATARERRAATEALRAQGTLGDASADVDDAWAWVNKSRTQKHAAAAAAVAVSARYDEQDEAATAAPGRGEYTGADLAGMRVHALGADDLEEGETMVLTLKDRRILDDDGEDGDIIGVDQLENVRLAELRKREAARKAASKGKSPGFDDDGDVAMTLGGGGGGGAAAAAAPKPALLAKYDDVSDGGGLVLGGGGLAASAPGGGGLASDDAAAARSAAMKAKLAAAAAALGGGGATTGLQSDFYSAAEMAAAAAPADTAAGAPPVKKLRKKQKHGRGGEVRRVHADELIPMAELAGPHGGDDATGGGEKQRTTLDDEAAVAWERFQAAKAKAAAASAQRIGSRVPVVASIPVVASGGGDGDDDESDRRLNAALERSRRVAAATVPLGGEHSVAALAASITRDAAGGDAAAGGGGNWLEATAEFVRSISVDKAAKRAQEHADAADAPDGIIGAPLIQAAEEGAAAPGDEGAGPGAPSHGGGGSSKRRQYRRPGAALKPSADVDMDDDGAAAFAPGSAAAAEPSALLAPVPEPTGVAGGGSKGLGATLAMLKATGSLGEGVTWAGRNTDKKGEAVRVATEAAGIATRDASWQFDFKLDRFDEFGRKMTPKEAFRELCHRFHGIFPSKSKQEARLKQWHEEQKQLKARDNDTPLASAEHMRAATQRTATPFVVLSGSVKSSQVSDARGHYAVAADEQLQQPQQQQQGGGGQAPGGGDARGAILQDTGITAAALAGQPPPLEGAAKVRFMLNLPQGGAGGVKRPGGGQDGGASKRQRTEE